MHKTNKHAKFEVIGLLLEIRRHKKSSAEENESSQYNIYPLESSKIREK